MTRTPHGWNTRLDGEYPPNPTTPRRHRRALCWAYLATCALGAYLAAGCLGWIR